MPPLIRRATQASLPTLISLTKLVHLIPRSSSQWTTLDASAPIEPEDPPDSPIFWWKLGLSMVLVLAGGVFAGLTLALMGSDDLNLRVLATSSSDPKERKAAGKVLRLLSRGRHWVLVVLLLSNVIVNESLPIFLDDVLGGGLYAVIVSTTMIVIFGEIIPQAVCVRYGLAIGGACAPLVWCFMVVFSPIAWPTAKLLDYILGKDEGHTYKKAELKSFLQFHREGEEPLRDDEIGILNGVLSLNDKHAQEIMTPIADCLTLPTDKVLDHDAIDQILLSGFSRIPVHEPGQKDNFVGMLLVKRLITYNPDDEWPVSKFPLLPLPEAKPEINCFQALDYFQTGRAHLLLISKTPGQQGGALGIVSLEDLIEEIIGEEIVDETDRYQDNQSKKAVKRSGTAAVMRGIIERRRVINAFSRRPSRSESQGPVGVPTPETGGNATSTTDGILVQIDNGALVAEPVGLTGEDDVVAADPSRRLVISGGIDNPGMSPIDEATPAELAALDAAETVAEVNEEGKSGGVESTATKTGLTEPEPADGATRSGTSSDAGANGHSGNSTGGGGKKKKKNKGKGKNGNGDSAKRNDDDRDEEPTPIPRTNEPFPTHEYFEKACKGMVEKYSTVKENELGPGRTNRGWEWREHKWVPHQGYLFRHTTRFFTSSQLSATTSTGQTPEKELEGQSEEGLEDDDDEAALLPQHAQHLNGDTRVRVEIDQHIVFSKTYRVPMYCFRAWDEQGAPLPAQALIDLNIVRPDSEGPQSEEPFEFGQVGAALDRIMLHAQRAAMPAGEDEYDMDTEGDFPLMQSTEHPTTGELVFSVHPCKVSGAVEEVLKAEGKGRGKGKRVEWLEVWMMLTGKVVDLVWP
ncbi:hypothetical protein IAT38_003988 [Cryptococcus sp. DSM 104549]